MLLDVLMNVIVIAIAIVTVMYLFSSRVEWVRERWVGGGEEIW